MWFTLLWLISSFVISVATIITGIVRWYIGEDIVSSLILANLGLCAFGINVIAADVHEKSLAKTFRPSKDKKE